MYIFLSSSYMDIIGKLYLDSAYNISLFGPWPSYEPPQKKQKIMDILGMHELRFLDHNMIIYYDLENVFVKDFFIMAMNSYSWGGEIKLSESY